MKLPLINHNEVQSMAFRYSSMCTHINYCKEHICRMKAKLIFMKVSQMAQQLSMQFCYLPMLSLLCCHAPLFNYNLKGKLINNTSSVPF